MGRWKTETKPNDCGFFIHDGEVKMPQVERGERTGEDNPGGYRWQVLARLQRKRKASKLTTLPYLTLEKKLRYGPSSQSIILS